MPRVIILSGYPHAVRPPDPGYSRAGHPPDIMLAGGDVVDDPHWVVDEHFSGNPADHLRMDLPQLRVEDLRVGSLTGHVPVHAFEARVGVTGHAFIKSLPEYLYFYRTPGAQSNYERDELY